MIISVTTHKGGSAKTTVSCLLAVYAARRTSKQILLIDVDHNRGSSSIFFSNKEPETSIVDAFQYYSDEPFDEGGIAEKMRAATSKVSGFDNLYVCQSSRKLIQISGMGLEAEALKDIISAAGFDRFPLVIIDSGTVPCVVSMCVAAADKLLIPTMMSQQCIGPTKNTIIMAHRKNKEILGLIPVTVGKSKWDQTILEFWREEITKTPHLGWQLGLMDGIPQSRSIVKTDLVTEVFPKVAEPAMEEIFNNLGLS